MTETGSRKIFSLEEIAKEITQVIRHAFPDYYWVKAEIAKLNFYPQSGHCYPDLVEKQNGIIKAQIRANIWSGNFEKINQKFKSVTGEPLKNGMKILFLSKVNYHERYGLSLNILDAEPAFTLGEMAREKQLTIQRLKKEGLFEKNKKQVLPLLPKRIAVISVETSKGYHDFKSVLENNSWNYSFQLTLFPALLQGEGAVSSIRSRLSEIALQHDAFDAVTIIRGGGGDVGLNAYDNYHLAKAIATFPLPVITGIGHSTNLTVVQMVAFANKITPTEAAHYLIQQFHNFAVRVDESQTKLLQLTENKLLAERQNFTKLARMITIHTRNLLTHHKTNWAYLTKDIEQFSLRILQNEKERYFRKLTQLQHQSQQKVRYENEKLKHRQKLIALNTKQFISSSKEQFIFLESKTQLLSPKNILKKGYSISFVDDRVLKTVTEATKGKQMTTRLSDGEIKSTIN